MFKVVSRPGPYAHRWLCRRRSRRAPVAGKRQAGAWLLPAVFVVGLVLALVWLIAGRTPPIADTRSIAVLPFVDLSKGQDNRYFAEAMQEELLTRLAKLEKLSIVSRSSVEQYRGVSRELPAVALELGVEAVIEGSVRLDGERVRITAQLVDANAGRRLWAETYDRMLSVENIFAIQRDMAAGLAQSLQLEYAESGAPATGDLPTTRIDAYQAYLLGRYHTLRQSPEDLELAVAFLQQAVGVDPEFAEAWVSLGRAYSSAGSSYGGREPREVYPKAKAAVTRALAIDSQRADARVLNANILTWYDWDFAAAEREYLEVLQLDPRNAPGYALLLSARQRHAEAIELIERRIAASPRDDRVRINAARIFLHARRHERAIEEALRAPRHPEAPAVLGYAYLGRGEFDRALDIFQADLATQGRRPRQLSQLAVASFKAGRNAEGRRLLAELEALADKAYLSPELIADVYFAAGDAENGYANLFHAVTTRARGVIFLQSSQLLDGYRDDRRYGILRKAVGF